MKIIKNLIDIFFPKLCIFCGAEGYLLCPDCRSTITLWSYHLESKGKYLDDLYFAADYNQFLVNFSIKKLKYNFLKDLAKDLAEIILDHFKILGKPPDFQDFLIIPIPLHEKRLRQRGFNQAEEIAKVLAEYFKIPLEKNVLFRKKDTLSQTELKREQRIQNVKDAFFVKDSQKIKNKNILLVDDVLTTGATMEEAAKTLKKAGAKKVVGVVLAKSFDF
jgi:ComF family protein